MASNRNATAGAQARHDLDDNALGQYLASSGKVPGLHLPVVTKKIGYGQSNPTYYVDDGRSVIDSEIHHLRRQYRDQGVHF